MENKVDDALSRKGFEGMNYSAIIAIQPAWIEEIQGSYSSNEITQEAIAEVLTYPCNLFYFSYKDGLLRYKDKLYVGSPELRKAIVDFMHSFLLVGTLGRQLQFIDSNKFSSGLS